MASVSQGDLSERMMMGATQQSIGADLRVARLARGESTADVAHQLRLREGYIEAIESGNFEVLPGVTYAIGFLRSYARYLRLDADDLIQRFKEEVSDITPPADLAFLEPVSESRVPRGGLVVLAVLLAVAAYGGWYYLSTRDLTIADLVPAVPDQFSNVMTSPDRPEAAPQLSDQGELTPPGPDSEATESVTGDSTVDGAPEAPERLGGGAADRVPPAPTTDLEATPGTSFGIPAVPPVAGAGDSAVRADGGAASEGPRVYGEGNAGSRITLRAGGESWIQVRAPDDTLLMTRTLRPGDSYRVPNQSGLKLMTGNAGALEILVDGETAPAIGAMGAVKRNVMLEPDRLKAGTAAN
jgi:cytoskeleton protein RodZ